MEKIWQSCPEVANMMQRQCAYKVQWSIAN